MQNSWPKFPSIVEEEHIKNRDRDFGKIHGREKIYHMTILWNSVFCVYQKMPTILLFYSNTDFDTFWDIFAFFGSFLHTVKTRWKWHRSGTKITGLKFFWKVCHASAMPLTKNDRNSIRTLFGSTFTRSRFCGYTRQIIIIKDFCGGTKTISLKCSVRFESWRKNFVLKREKLF